MHKLSGIFLVASLWAHSVFAATFPEEIDVGPIPDWITLNRKLESRGFNIVEINWAFFNPLCGKEVGGYTNEAKFSECRFRKVLMRDAYLKDRAYCERQAKRNYPYGLLKGGGMAHGYTMTDPQGNVTGYAIDNAESWRGRDLKTFRQDYIADCMDFRGSWANPNDWTAGRNR